MNKTNKQLRYFVKSLLKYAEKDEHFNPNFTTEQIPAIFKGWDAGQFNKIYHGAGAGCCIYIGPDRYSINEAHCLSIKNKFIDSSRIKWMLIIAIATIIFTIAISLFAYLNYRYNRSNQDTQRNRGTQYGQEQPNFQRHGIDKSKHKAPPKK